MFYAHSLEGQVEERWEPLATHLAEVAYEAAQRTEKFGCGDLGQLAGLLHDFGKYKAEFQERIRKQRHERVDHSSAGAVFALERLGPLGRLIAHPVAGHHAGLQDSLLAADGRLARRQQELNSALRGHRIAGDGTRLPTGPPRPPSVFKPGPEPGFSWAFLIRMLFSALVDADYICTERFYARAEGRDVDRGPGTDLDGLSDALHAHLKNRRRELEALGTTRSTINLLRNEVLETAVGHAGDPQGVFTLTVPTGGGKTLTSLAFALEHARRHGLERVIVVIPFTSVVEQTARVFREAFGALADEVLEHHSAFEETWLRSEERQGRSKLTLAMETWDARIVVTTAVQFFEGLYANRPAQCRKLHNIARSVVVLDEAQTMPLHLLQPCVAALKELARSYRTTVVLCTATQPALKERQEDVGKPPTRHESFPDGFVGSAELAPPAPALFAALRRVEVRHVGVLDDAEVAARMAAEPSALCIVNSRAHARELFDRIGMLPGTWHLSTLMYPVHRAAALKQIRADLHAGAPCRVVSTSLIEAGVDIDFPHVLRAEVGLDQIAQAAGRCNREGKRNRDGSQVVVFEPAAHGPPPALKQAVEAGREMLRKHAADPLSPSAIEEYFNLLYWRKGQAAFDTKGILQACREAARSLDFPFGRIAKDMRLIDDIMKPVIVARDTDARQLVALLADSTCKMPLGKIARQLQRYTVGIPEKARISLLNAKVAQPVREEALGDQFVLLLNNDLYRQDVGLTWDDPTAAVTGSLIA